MSLEGGFMRSWIFANGYRGWTASGAVFNEVSTGILVARQEVKDLSLFKLSGFDWDDGSEALNYHLVSCSTKRLNRLEFTRSSPHHKNDNGRVKKK